MPGISNRVLLKKEVCILLPWIIGEMASLQGMRNLTNLVYPESYGCILGGSPVWPGRRTLIECKQMSQKHKKKWKRTCFRVRILSQTTSTYKSRKVWNEAKPYCICRNDNMQYKRLTQTNFEYYKRETWTHRLQTYKKIRARLENGSLPKK